MMRALLVALAAFGGVHVKSTGDDHVVSAAWLNQHLKDPDVVILQVAREGDYGSAHVPGSQRVEGKTFERDAMVSGASMDMGQLPSAAELHAKLEKFGISNGTHVVAVFTGNQMAVATRVLLLVEYAGIGHVSLMDGGFEAWKRAGLPVTSAVPTVKPGKVTVSLRPKVAVGYAYVQAHLNAPYFKIIDARDAVYYSSLANDDKMGMAPGHIPGAKNIPFTSMTDDAGMLLPVDQITAKFRAAGVQPGDTVIAYCHVGMQATAVMLGARLIGQPVQVYAQSFHDWADRKLPIEYSKP